MDHLGVALFQETSICLEALDVDHILGQLLEAWQTWQSWRSDGPGNSDEHRDLTYNNGWFNEIWRIKAHDSTGLIYKLYKQRNLGELMGLNLHWDIQWDLTCNNGWFNWI